MQTSVASIELASVEELLEQLQQAELAQRHKAIEQLAQRGDSRAMQPLVERLVSADEPERGLINQALSAITTRTIESLNQGLTIAFQDEYPSVRQNALRSLTRLSESIPFSWKDEKDQKGGLIS